MFLHVYVKLPDMPDSLEALFEAQSFEGFSSLPKDAASGVVYVLVSVKHDHWIAQAQHALPELGVACIHFRRRNPKHS